MIKAITHKYIFLIYAVFTTTSMKKKEIKRKKQKIPEKRDSRKSVFFFSLKTMTKWCL